jgi:hypothetical protein
VGFFFLDRLRIQENPTAAPAAIARRAAGPVSPAGGCFAFSGARGRRVARRGNGTAGCCDFDDTACSFTGAFGGGSGSGARLESEENSGGATAIWTI